MQERIQSEITMQLSNHKSKRVARNLMGGVFTGRFPLRLRCECGQPQCDEVVEVPTDLGWEAKLMRPLFIIAPHHEQLDIEKIVEKTANYYVVKKDLSEDTSAASSWAQLSS